MATQKEKKKFEAPEYQWVFDQVPHDWRKSYVYESGSSFSYMIEGATTVRNSGFKFIPLVIIVSFALPLWLGFPFWVAELSAFLSFLSMGIRELIYKPKPGKKMAPIFLFEIDSSKASFSSPNSLDIESKEDFNSLVVPFGEISSVGEITKAQRGDEMSWLRLKLKNDYYEFGAFRSDQTQLIVKKIKEYEQKYN